MQMSSPTIIKVNIKQIKSRPLPLTHPPRDVIWNPRIDDSPYYVFVALCIVVIVVSLIKIAASNENIECFRKYFAVVYRAPDPNFF
jgi:hypothetical protein